VRELQRLGFGVHVDQELTVVGVLHLQPVELEAAARALELDDLGAHVVVLALAIVGLLAVVNVEEAHGSLAQRHLVARLRVDEARLELRHTVGAEVELKQLVDDHRVRLATVHQIALHVLALRPGRQVLRGVHDHERGREGVGVGLDSVQLDIRRGPEELWNVGLAHVPVVVDILFDFVSVLLALVVPRRAAKLRGVVGALHAAILRAAHI